MFTELKNNDKKKQAWANPQEVCGLKGRLATFPLCSVLGAVKTRRVFFRGYSGEEPSRRLTHGGLSAVVGDGNAPGHEGTPQHSEGRGRGRGLLPEKKLPNCHEVQRAVTQERVGTDHSRQAHRRWAPSGPAVASQRR